MSRRQARVRGEQGERLNDFGLQFEFRDKLGDRLPHVRVLVREQRESSVHGLADTVLNVKVQILGNLGVIIFIC